VPTEVAHRRRGRRKEETHKLICFQPFCIFWFSGEMRARKRAIYVAVLAVGIVALLVDRLFLGPQEIAPEQSKAATTGSDVRPDPAAKPSASPPAGRQTPAWTETISSRLMALANREKLDLANVTDAFRPGTGWRREPPPQASKAVPKTSPAKLFRQRHRLLATVADEQGGKAIVDGICLRVGDQLDGLTLVAIGDGVAIFAWRDIRAELRLASTREGSP